MAELLELWTAWWSGPLERGTITLWGKPLWWWERLGTFVQVAAILGLVFELIGERRALAAADRLREPPAWLLEFTGKSSSSRSEPSKASELGAALFAFLIFVLTFAGSLFLAEFYVPLIGDAVDPIVTEYLPEWASILTLVIVGVIAWLPAAVITLICVILTVPYTFQALLRGFAGILRSPRLRAGLNAAILLASAFNLHFTLLAQ